MEVDPIRKAQAQRRHLNEIYKSVTQLISTLEHQAKILRSFAEKTRADMQEIETRYELSPIPAAMGAVIRGDSPFLADHQGHTLEIPESILKNIMADEGKPPFDNPLIKE